MSFLLDPKYGGRLRALVALLSFVVALLTSPAVVDLGFTWVTPIIAGANGLLSILAHFTHIGNRVPPEVPPPESLLVP